MTDPQGDASATGGAPDALLAAVVDQLPVGVVVAEAPGGRVVHGNGRLREIFGARTPLPESLADYDVWLGFHADGKRYRADEWPLARALRGETVEGEEIAIQDGSGNRRVFRASAAPVRDGTGRVVAGVTTITDVTAEKGRDRARRFLSEASKQLGSSLDYETTLRNVARLAVPALADWCAVDVLRDGKLVRLAIEQGDPEKAGLADELTRHDLGGAETPVWLTRVLRTGRPELMPDISDELIRALAHDEDHLRTLRALGPRSAMVVPLVARARVLGDITLISAESGRRFGREDLEIAEELAARAAMAIDNAGLFEDAQEASRAKTDFLAVISHELRTPLTAIIGYAELLSLGVPDPVTPRQEEQIERIQISAHHLLLLIEEILTITSLEAGQMRVRRVPVYLHEVFERAEVLIQPLAAEKGITLHVEHPEQALVIESDPEKVVQILTNLLSNAVKFTEQGSVRARTRLDVDHVEVEVSDTGIGIQPKDRTRVFEPFWQAEPPITRRAGGTGLGLTITRRLLELLGGEIRVESEPGAGSTFTVRFPLRITGASDAPE